MKLFLSGGGGGQESFHLDKKFIESIDRSKPVLYIPIAMNTLKHSYSDCLEWLKGNFKVFNFDNFTMWTEEELKGKTEKDFEHFGGIYIGGGNTFKLLSDLKEFGTFEILRSIALKSIPIYGGSAGAIVLTWSILTASYLDENEINLSDLSALNLLDIDVWCHYKDQMNSDVREFMEEHNIQRIIAIPEDAGIFVTEEGLCAIGPNNITIFNGDSKVTVLEGEPIV